MANLERQNEPARLFLRRVGTALLFVVTIALLVSDWSVARKERESRALRVQAETQYRNLSEQEKKLNDRIAGLRSDRGKEEALREQFEFGRQGEGLIVIVDPPVPKPIEATSTLMKWVHKFLPFW